MTFEFNNSGKEDTHFTNLNPYFFSYQFQSLNSGEDDNRNEFFLLDNYGVKYHYDEDFAKDGIDILAGIYGHRIRTNRNVGVFELQKILEGSKKEFTELKHSYLLGDLDFDPLASFRFQPNFGIAIFYTPPRYKHLSLSLFVYNEFFNFYQEVLLWGEIDNSDYSINQAIQRPEYASLKNYCKEVFGIDFDLSLPDKSNLEDR